ncbi:MAG: hypothetical protein DWI09_05065 [Planctomycetota bacterium]|nr:MAG: hypothetical protein DWI09_05065 [Planctomycetota bacterium]
MARIRCSLEHRQPSQDNHATILGGVKVAIVVFFGNPPNICAERIELGGRKALPCGFAERLLAKRFA